MIASDVIRRFECRQAMIERERKEYHGKLPSVRTQKGEWGTYRNNTGLKSIIRSENAGSVTYMVRYYEGSRGIYVGRYDNVRSAVDSLCNSCKITPMQIEGMTKETWDLIKSQPIILSRTYKGGN